MTEKIMHLITLSAPGGEVYTLLTDGALSRQDAAILASSKYPSSEVLAVISYEELKGMYLGMKDAINNPATSKFEILKAPVG